MDSDNILLPNRRLFEEPYNLTFDIEDRDEIERLRGSPPLLRSSPPPFSQHAQNPYENLSPLVLQQRKDTKLPQKRQKHRKEKCKKHSCHIIETRHHRLPPSYVLNGGQCSGDYLIKIQILDITDNRHLNTGGDCKEKILLSAQYVAENSRDSIMDQSETVINPQSTR